MSNEFSHRERPCAATPHRQTSADRPQRLAGDFLGVDTMSAQVTDFQEYLDDMKIARLLMRSGGELSLDELNFVCTTLWRSSRSDDQLLADNAHGMAAKLAAKEANHDSRRMADEGSVFTGIINAFLIVAALVVVWSVTVSVKNFWAVTEDAAMGAQ